jgi:3-isopropylmalate/(R)-2-methylmalate dehydratase small subunit
MQKSFKRRGTAHVFGDDVPHDGAIMAFSFTMSRTTDPEQLIPHLFEQLDPTFKDRVKPGDFIVAGKNLGCGKAHTAGYIAMQALGLGILCESMPAAVVRATVNLALPCMTGCTGITALIASGDQIEVDFETGEVANLTRGERNRFNPIPQGARDMISRGGLNGTLIEWLKNHPEQAEPPIAAAS